MSKYLISNLYKYIVVIFLLCATTPVSISQSIRSIDGYGNNIENPAWGAVNEVQPRLSFADYADGISIPKLGVEYGKENPRVISNRLFAQEEKINSDLSLSDFTWVFGQFIDHDIILTEETHEPLNNIVIPEDDEVFTPGTIIRMTRSESASGTGASTGIPREHFNNITAYLDLSTVYGSDPYRANWLRSHVDGKLKVSLGNMLPWNTIDANFNSNVDPNSPSMKDATKSLIKLYVAGDVRANENPLLLSYHTLFVREHNRLCDEEKSKHSGWNDERLYQGARKKLIAFYQRIIFNEWLPTLGINLPDYNGYKANVNSQISNEFSTAAFQMGHTLINGAILRMDNGGEQIKEGHISLRAAFFNPLVLEYAGGIDSYFKGMGTQVLQEFDISVIDDLRNFLFSVPGSDGLDLAAININRGRERGIPDYNSIRESMGMPKLNSFTDLTDGNQSRADQLENVFGSIDNIDAWVGMLSEPHIIDGLFGNLVTGILKNQFQALREGDRFYFENVEFQDTDMTEIMGITMRDILMRNTGIHLMQDEVFRAMPHQDIEEGPDLNPFPLTAAIFPNPVENIMQIKVYGSKTEDISISIIDYLGRTVSTTNHHIHVGNNIFNVDLVVCPRGYYNVVLETENRFNIIKMIKK